MEVRYTYDKTTCKDRRPPEAIWAEVRSRMPEGLFVSGGSDYHADYKKGQDNPRDLGNAADNGRVFIRPRLRAPVPDGRLR